MDWLDVAAQGILLGGVYGLFALGLSLVFGIMRLVNLAHGDLIVLAAYLVLFTSGMAGLPLGAATLLAVAAMFVLGYLLQRFVLDRVLGDDIMPPLLVTFGLSVIIQNGLLEVFTADSQKLQAGAIEVATMRLSSGVYVGVLPLLQFAECRNEIVVRWIVGRTPIKSYWYTLDCKSETQPLFFLYDAQPRLLS